MVIQSLGTQYRVQGTRLVMEKGNTTSPQEVLPKTNSNINDICKGPDFQVSSQKDKEHQIPGASVLCTKKGYTSKESF